MGGSRSPGDRLKPYTLASTLRCMATTTVRVQERTREALTRLSRERGISTAEYLDQLVSRREEDQMLEQMNAAYARLQEDPDAWQVERAERGAWEHTLLDGLEEL